MDAAATKAIGEVEVYRQIAGFVRNVVARCAEGVSQEESLIQPDRMGTA